MEAMYFILAGGAIFGNRVPRVIYNQTRTPPHIVTVYFDRSIRGPL